MTDEQRYQEMVEKHARGFAEQTRVPLAAARKLIASAMDEVNEAVAAGRDPKGLYLAALQSRTQGLRVN